VFFFWFLLLWKLKREKKGTGETVVLFPFIFKKKEKAKVQICSLAREVRGNHKICSYLHRVLTCQAFKYSQLASPTLIISSKVHVKYLGQLCFPFVCIYGNLNLFVRNKT